MLWAQSKLLVTCNSLGAPSPQAIPDATMSNDELQKWFVERVRKNSGGFSLAAQRYRDLFLQALEDYREQEETRVDGNSLEHLRLLKKLNAFIAEQIISVCDRLEGWIQTETDRTMEPSFAFKFGNDVILGNAVIHFVLVATIAIEET